MANGEIHVQLAVNYGEDPKLRALARYGHDARGLRDLYVQMVCHCKRNLTDGFVLTEELGVLVYPDSLRIGRRDADRLVDAGLLEAREGGYLVVAFLKRNKSKAQVEELSVTRAKSGRKGGVRSGQVRRSEAKPKQDASRSPKQLASVGLNTETETETETVPTTSGAANPRQRETRPRPDEFNPGPIVAAYVEGAIDAGLQRPASTLRARVGKQARELHRDGYTAAALAESARRMGAGEWNDLAVQVRKDDAAANGRRLSTGDRRLADAERLKRELR